MKNSESGRSRGFGFVTFSDPANVAMVLQNGPHTLDGRTVCIFHTKNVLYCKKFMFQTQIKINMLLYKNKLKLLIRRV